MAAITSRVVTLALPERRMAVFSSLLYGEYWVLLHGEDIERGPKWGGFVRWVGGVRPAMTVRKSVTHKVTCSGIMATPSSIP